MRNIVVEMTCLWFVFLSVVVVSYPEVVGRWQAKVEFAFLEEADKLGLWGE